MSGPISLDRSLDENGNQLTWAPSSHSTPKRNTRARQSQAQLLCPYCGKKYVVKHYFLNHVEIHEAQQLSAPDSNVSNSVHLDVSDVSFSLLTQTQKVISPSPAKVFRIPATPSPPIKKAATFKKNKKPHLVCTYCLKGYVCSRSFKTHVRLHLIQVAASRFSNTKEIVEHAEEIGQKALLQVTNGPCIGESAAEFRHLLGHVVTLSTGEEFRKFTTDICTDMVKSIGNAKFLLPSALVNSLMEDQENILSNPDLSDGFLKTLSVQEQFTADVCAQFFLKFLLFFITELLQYISRSFKANHPFRAETKILSEPDKQDRQVIYYIVGSIIRGYLKIAQRFPKSISWQEVVSVLQSKVLVDKPEGDMSPDAEWTTDVDRGVSLFLNAKCQDLFVKISKVVFLCAKKDGSIEYEAVIKEVLNSELSCDWDNIVCDSLSESVSLNLLSDIIQCFCRTCGRGIAKRRLNFVRHRPVASMTTRHLAASRRKH